MTEQLRFHPLADIFPLLEGDEFAGLVADIGLHGLLEPIVVDDGLILDGRNRWRACQAAGVQVRTRPFTGSDPLAFVLSANLHRRHLNESQRAMVAEKLATMPRGGDRRSLSYQSAISRFDTITKSAGQLNVSERSVQYAREVRERAIPAIVTAVEQGRMPVSQAAQVARLSEPMQERVAAEMDNGKSLLTTVLAASRAERVATIERASSSVPLSALGRTFPVLYADPPWHFQAWSAGGQQKAAEMHYPTMPLADICALPVADIAARDSVLFMWAVPALFPEALEVVKAWGFAFKTFAVWVKPQIACGHWFRGQHEPLICATRGDMPPPPSLHSSVFEGVTSGRHSEKPAAIRDWIAEAYPHAGKIELFARVASPGWHSWGHEAPTIAAE